MGIPQTSSAQQADDRKFGLIEVAIILAKNKGLLVGLPFIGGCLILVLTFALNDIFVATTRILPPQPPQQSSAALLGQLSALAGGVGPALGGKSPADLYVGMLKSRTIADRLIDRFDLKRLYRVTYSSDARKLLQKASRISVGKDGIITLDVENADRALAATMANAYVEELIKLNSTLAVTEASQRRLFFERQLELARANLSRAESAAGSAIDSGGLTAVEAKGKSVVETSAFMRARIASKEVEISAMQGYAAPDNPDVGRARRELAALREQLGKLEGRTGTGRSTEHDVAGLKNVALVREVKYNEFLLELLAKQYETARLDEAREGAIIQILDSATVPDVRTYPRRALITIVATVILFCMALVVIFMKEIIRQKMQSVQSEARLSELLRELRFKRRSN